MAFGAVVSTLCGGAAGLLGSTLPHVVDLIKTRNEQNHDLAIRQLELGNTQARAIEALAKSTNRVPDEPPPDVPEVPECSVVTDHWIGVLSALVRPVITYTFFALFLVVKAVGLWVLLRFQHVSVSTALETIWDDNTQVTFVAVLAFWFGQRSLLRYGGTQ